MSNTVILLKKSVVSGNTPSSLSNGEIAINTADGLLFYKNPSNVIKYFRNSDSFSTVNVNSTLLLATSPTDILSYASNNGINLAGNPSTDTITISGISASTTNVGVVRLYDGVNSNSASLAATANSVNVAYTLANAAYTALSSVITVPSLTNTYKMEEFTANSGQTNVVVSGGYTSGNVSVYVNGVLLNHSDYVANDGNNVSFITPLSSGDNVVVGKWYYDKANTVYLNAIQRYDQFTANSGQVVFNTAVNYVPGYIRIFRNGVLLEQSEYTANNGANVSLTHAASANDIITIHQWDKSEYNAAPFYVIAQQAYDYSNTALTLAVNMMPQLQSGNLTSNVVTTSSNTANQILDIFASSSYRSVKYQIQITSGTDYQYSEVSLIHNGTTSYITEYGLISTNSTLANYDTNISGGNVRLLISPVNNINTIKLIKTSITV